MVGQPGVHGVGARPGLTPRSGGGQGAQRALGCLCHQRLRAHPSEASLSLPGGLGILRPLPCRWARLAAPSSPLCNVDSAALGRGVQSRSPAPCSPCQHPAYHLHSSEQAACPPVAQSPWLHNGTVTDSGWACCGEPGSLKHPHGCRVLSAGPSSGAAGTRAVIQVGTVPRGARPGVCRAVVLPPLPVSCPCLRRHRRHHTCGPSPRREPPPPGGGSCCSPSLRWRKAAEPPTSAHPGPGSSRSPRNSGCQPDSPATSLGNHVRPL